MPGGILASLLGLLVQVLHIYELIILIAVLITWVNPDPYNPIVRFLRRVTEPLFQFIRRTLPVVVQGGFDFSPIVVLMLVHLLQRYLAGLSFQVIGAF